MKMAGPIGFEAFIIIYEKIKITMNVSANIIKLISQTICGQLQPFVKMKFPALKPKKCCY